MTDTDLLGPGSGDEPMTARQITTAAELDALPVGSVMRARNGSLAERGVLSDGTPCVWTEGWSTLDDAIEHHAPFTVLHDPSADGRPAHPEAGGA